MPVNSQQISEILIDVAARLIVPRFRNLGEADISTKSHATDFVTIADTETEEALVEILPKIVPGCLVIGEEGVSSGKISIDRLKETDKTIFVVDPIDGTFNFKNGDPTFAVMMAMVEGGETVMSWIYDVIGQSMAWAEKGAGAFMGKTRMAVAEAKPLQDCHGFFNRGYMPKAMREHMDYLKQETQNVASVSSLHCSAHEYLRIASGRADFSINGWTKPWDHLAGVLMVREAGGVAAKWDGSAYVPGDEKGGLIVASNQDLWDDIHGRFIKPALEKMAGA